MGSACFPCGCGWTRDMFADRLVDVFHCAAHYHLRDPDKTLHQMQDELIAVLAGQQ